MVQHQTGLGPQDPWGSGTTVNVYIIHDGPMFQGQLDFCDQVGIMLNKARNVTRSSRNSSDVFIPYTAIAWIEKAQ